MSIPKSPRWRKDNAGLENASFDTPVFGGSDNSFMPSNKMFDFKSIFGGVNPGSFMQTLSTALSGLRTLQKPLKEKPINADFTKGNALSETLNINNQAILNENTLGANAAKMSAQDASRNFGQYNNRVQNIMNNLGRLNTNALFQNKQMNNALTQYNIQRADSQALGNQQEAIRTAENNLRNSAMSGDMTQAFLNQIGNMGSAMEQKRALDMQVKNLNTAQKQQFLLNLNAISAKNPNFTINKAEFDKFMVDPTSANFDNIIMFNQ